jgi:hypothetical protein
MTSTVTKGYAIGPPAFTGVRKRVDRAARVYPSAAAGITRRSGLRPGGIDRWQRGVGVGESALV